MSRENKIESMADLFRMSPEKFLKIFAPHRIQTLKNALRKIGFDKYKGKLIADLTMPLNVAGYYSPDQNVIAISPMLLINGSEKEIAHVLFHEGLHAGIFTKGTELLEESVVETMTKKKIKELYGGLAFRSGYDGLVKEAEEFFGDLSYNEMVEQVEDGDEEAFDRFLELVLIRPAIGSTNIDELKWTEIRKKLKRKWKVLKKLFPRMINKISKANRGLHEDAKMEAYEYKLESLLEKAAHNILGENQEIILEILLELTKNGTESLDLEKIKKLLVREGFGYIYDKEPSAMDRAINSYIAQCVELKLEKEEISKQNLELKLD